MSPRLRLAPSDRHFFGLVSRAAFSNPFGAERDALDQAIAEVTGAAPDLIARVTARVGARLDTLEARHRIDPARYDTRDGELLEHAVLFHAFHRFADDLDALIERQLAGQGRLRVRFVRDFRQVLERRGLTAARATRMLELFYQMRRAHRFIGTALVGTSARLRAVREGLWNNVFTHDVGKYDRYLWNRMEDFSTILVGETGTGKSAAAQAIGWSGFVSYDETQQQFGERFTDALVAVNLSEFPPTLLESELFGHRKGAFTGAVEAHEGWLARCRPHGTIFLDEIGDLSPDLQVKLLRVLQERTYSPVGSHERRPFAGRVVAATHRPLERLRAEGRFRDDFYYRLCSDVIALPPLRVQLEEEPGLLGELVDHLLARILGERFPDLGAEVTGVLERDLGRDHPFEGNVRELEQRIRRVLLTGRGLTGASDRRIDVAAPRLPFLDRLARGELDAAELLSAYCTLLYERLGSYAEVAAQVKLDPRTVRRYVRQATSAPPPTNQTTG